MAQLSEKHKKVLEHQHYEIVGKHSAVEICGWCKKSLLDEGVCYKQKFYGIQSHRCCQMTPSAGWCDQKCVFCWRAHELNEGLKMTGKVDEPIAIIEGCIKAQKRKLSGFKGNIKVNMQKWKEAQEPMQFAISLTGEPTLYPKLPGLIKELHKRGKTTFLVTNGQHPKMLLKLKKEKSLPTQLYVSLDAPNEKMHKRINIPLLKNSWKNLNKTLELLPKLDCRKVVRITLIKGLNDCCIPEYAKLIKKASHGTGEFDCLTGLTQNMAKQSRALLDPEKRISLFLVLRDGKRQAFFISLKARKNQAQELGIAKLMVEVKSYMHLGFSQKRLKRENMPSHEEVMDFSKKLAKQLGWKVLDESKPSRVVLIAKRDFSGRIMHR